MDISVVVTTLNSRTQLARCLDALSAHAPEAEVVVVNGPSTDGTTGMVRDRGDIDVLVEIAERNLSAARNAGIEHARGDWIAFVGDQYSIEEGWAEPLRVGSGAERELSAGRSLLANAIPTVASDAAGRVGSAATATTWTVSDRLGRLVPWTRGRDDPRADAGEADGGNGNGAGDPSRPADDRVAVVTGPIHRELTGGVTTQSSESQSIGGHEVRYFNVDNAAFDREVLEGLDGFDEYLPVGSARDLAHRLAADGYAVAWEHAMSVRGEYGADGTGRDLHWTYRSLAYRLCKNYGVRPSTVRRVVVSACSDGLAGTRDVVCGDLAPSTWFATGRDALSGAVVGAVDGLVARWRDRDRHNPNGCSARTDRSIKTYDRR